MFLKVHGLGWMRPFSAGTYSCAMDRFMTPRDIENREQLFYWFEQKWLYLLVPWYFEISSLGVTHRENFSHMGCLWERKLVFLFLLSCRYPRESRKSTGDWLIFNERCMWGSFALQVFCTTQGGGCISGTVCIGSGSIISLEGQNGFWSWVLFRRLSVLLSKPSICDI